MTPRQYQAAKHELGFTDQGTAQLIGVNVSTIYRWLARPPLPQQFAVLMRALVRLRATMSKARFDEFISDATKGV